MILSEENAHLTNETANFNVYAWLRDEKNNLVLRLVGGRYIAFSANESGEIGGKLARFSVLSVSKIDRQLNELSAGQKIEYWYRPNNLELTLRLVGGQEITIQQDSEGVIRFKKAGVKVMLKGVEAFGRAGGM